MDWHRLLSRKRLGTPGQVYSGSVRTDFQRDFDRIVFSSAFRRLQDKTQVFPLSDVDYVRTRLSHSLEASCVGRTLGTLVGERILARRPLANVEASDFGAVVAAACLAHDIGNPPFGHSGEDAIRTWFTHSATGCRVIERLTGSQRADFLLFEGNAQGFRVLTRLQSPDNRGGMQLTCATLGTFAKYPRESCIEAPTLTGSSVRKYGFFADDAALFAELAEDLGLIHRPCGDHVWCRHPLAFLVEAADDICYRVVDLEDGFRMGLLDFDEIYSLLSPIVSNSQLLARLDKLCELKDKVEYLRARAINQVVLEIADAFMEREVSIREGHFDAGLIAHIPSAEEMERLIQVATERVYCAHSVIEIEVAGFQILGGLLETFVGAVNEVAEQGDQASPKSHMLLRLIPRQFLGPEGQPAQDLYRRVLAVTDFVSGMTDSYAVNLYKKITGISLPEG
jgi:dGTPase